MQSIAAFVNFPNMQTWSVSRGLLYLQKPAQGVASQRWPYRVESLTRDKLTLTADPIADTASAQSRTARVLHMSRVDGAAIGLDPMLRFPNGNFVRMETSADSLRYFFQGNHSPGGIERYEIAHIAAGDTSWLSFQLVPGQTILTTSQSGFFFRMTRRDSLGRKASYQATSISDSALVIRQERFEDRVEGSFIGQLKRYAGSTELDSMMTINGEFRFVRSRQGPLRSPLWP